MGILSKIDGKVVRFAGLLLAIFAGIWTGSYYYLVAIGFATLTWLFGKQIIGKSKPFDNFADPKYWPTFVTLGVVSLVMAPPGKRLMTAAIWTILDGMYFAQNY